MTLRQKMVTGIAGILVVVALALAISFSYQIKIAGAITPRYPSDDVATTTTTFLKVGTSATTTPSNTDGYEQLSYFVILGASTTPPTLCWRNQFSFDGIDWYAEDKEVTSNASTTVHVMDGREDCWTYASTTGKSYSITGTSSVKYITKKIVVPNLDSTFTRTIFYLSSGGDALISVKSALKNTLILPK